MLKSPKFRSIFDLDRPAIIAHRGASAYSPENTLTSFKLAIEQDADAIELDAKLTADGEVVVIHDDTVDRTTNGSGRVNSLTLAELQQLDAGVKHVPRFPPENIPSLAQVFEAIGRKIHILVELKNLSSPLDELPEKVVALVRKYNLEESVLLISFNLIALIRAQRALPNASLGYLTSAGLADMTFRSKLVRFGPRLNFLPNYKDVTPALVRVAHQAKTRIYSYTIDQPEPMAKLFKLNIDGILTNDPVLAQKVRADSWEMTQ